MASLTDFLNTNILTSNTELSAITSGALSIIDGIINTSDLSLANTLADFVAGGDQAVANLVLSYDQLNTLESDQSTTSTLYDPVLVPITSNAESVTFEQLPNGREDLLMIGDCVIGKAKAVNFTLVNTGDKDLKFRWSSGTPEREEFTFYPSIGHLKSGSSKQIKVMVRGKDTKKYENIDFICET